MYQITLLPIGYINDEKIHKYFVLGINIALQIHNLNDRDIVYVITYL